MTWDEAKTLASSNGGKLSVPGSQEENNYLRDYQFEGWLGLYDPNYSANYCLSAPCPTDKARFVSLSTPLTGSLNFSNWASGEPNNRALAEDFNGSISPVGEHWGVFNTDGTWSSVGNHAGNDGPLKMKGIIEWQEILDCVKPQPDPNTTPQSGYYCVDSAGNYGQCQDQSYAATGTYICTSYEQVCGSWGQSCTTSGGGGCECYGNYSISAFYWPGLGIICGLNTPHSKIYYGPLCTGTQTCTTVCNGYVNGACNNGYTQYSCPSGGNLAGTTCDKKVCPFTGISCLNAGDPSNTQNLDTQQGATDKKNNGTVTESGCQGNIYIFNGKDMRCRTKDAFGLAGSCCDKDKVLMGLIQCKPEEKDWAKLTSDGKCHYIGDYCAKKFLGSCQTKKQTHCCFNSKLARIIQEQGRPQLDMSWGSAESPNCRGFKPDEFQKLDFSKIDFSEFYEEIEQKAMSVLSSGAIQSKINTSIEAIKTKKGAK